MLLMRGSDMMGCKLESSMRHKHPVSVPDTNMSV